MDSTPYCVFVLLLLSFDRVALGSDPLAFAPDAAFSFVLTSTDRVVIRVLGDFGVLGGVPLGVGVSDVGVRVSVPIVPEGELSVESESDSERLIGPGLTAPFLFRSCL